VVAIEGPAFAIGIVAAVTPRSGLYTPHSMEVSSRRLAGPSPEAAFGVVLKNSSNLMVEAISKRIGHVNDPHSGEFQALIESPADGEGVTASTRFGCPVRQT
jgi:hypothetical protein